MISCTRRIRVLALCLGAIAGLAGLQGARAAAVDAPCPLQLQLSPTRNNWARGEAIEVGLRFSNPGNRAIVLPMAYPSLAGYGAGIAFALDGVAPDATVEPNVRASLVRIPAHASWEIRVYLGGVEPGRHPVRWTLEMACLNEGAAAPLQLKRDGSFTVQVAAAPPAAMATQIDGYLQGVDSGDQWRRLEGIEALANTSDPAVLPALQKLYQYGHRSDALRALRKFDGVPQAGAILADILLSSSGTALRNAVQLARAWRSDLPAPALAPLVSSERSDVKLELIDYMAQRRSPAYEALLKTLATAADDNVARAARAALAATPPR